MKRIFFIVIVFNLVGCALGVGLSHHKTRPYENKIDIPSEKFSWYDYLKNEPDEKTIRDDGVEEWKYYWGPTSWKGITIWALLPIPLRYPSGQSSLVYEIENGRAVKETIYRVRPKNYMIFTCGVIGAHSAVAADCNFLSISESR